MRFFFAVLLLLTIPATTSAEQIDTPARFASFSEVMGRVGACRNLTISAYMLTTGSPIVEALEAAADRGCRLNVILDGRAFGYARTANAAVEPELRSHHIRVIISVQPLHLKALIADGHTYFSDRNWAKAGDALIISDDNPLDYRMIYTALICSSQNSDDITVQCPPTGNNHLWVVKKDALAAEAAVIRSGQARDVSVESESWGPGTDVERAVEEMAGRGYHVRLLVASLEYRERSSESERRSLAALAARGVSVRVGPATEKIAINGTCVWTGSSNSTRGLADQIDWGLAFCGTDFSSTVAEHFEDNWNAGSPIAQ